MQLNIGQVSLVDYLGMLERKEILVNKDYQRQKGVWPDSARTYFIDTLLEGYPIPKIYWFQSFNEKTGRPIKELVDGQQRTTTMQDFYNNKFALNSASQNFKGKRYSDLDPETKQKFLSFQVEYSTVLSATRSELLEMFRRMNSYTAPLKEAEKRHSIYQGAFKWFIVEQADSYAPLLAGFGVLTEKNINRMGDAEFIAELALVIEDGLVNKSSNQLSQIYRRYDEEFDLAGHYDVILTSFFEEVQNELEFIGGTTLSRSYVFHSLFCAYTAIWFGFEGSEELLKVCPNVNFNPDYSLAIPRLELLAEAVEDDEVGDGFFKPFYEACEQSTTKRKQRTIRTRYLVWALTGNEDVLSL